LGKNTVSLPKSLRRRDFEAYNFLKSFLISKIEFQKNISFH
jgi:hypothetical protein